MPVLSSTSLEHLEQLASRLGTDPSKLAGFRDLSAQQLEVLDSTVMSAMREQDASLQDALTIALRFVPKPLRSMTRNILFGGEPSA